MGLYSCLVSMATSNTINYSVKRMLKNPHKISIWLAKESSYMGSVGLLSLIVFCTV